MTARNVALPLLLAIGILPIGGCYTYVSIQPDQAVVGERVRAAVHPDAAADVAGQLQGNVTGLRGTVLRNEPDRLFVSLDVLETATGGELFWTGDPLSLQPTSILALEQRAFSWPRTVVFAAGIAVGLYVLDQGMNLGISRVLTPKETDPEGPEDFWPVPYRP